MKFLPSVFLAFFLASLPQPSQAAQLAGAVRINSDTTGTNTKSSAITITAQTNLFAGTLTSTGSVTGASFSTPSSSAGSVVIGDGGSHTFRIAPQTISTNINLIPDTAPGAGFLFGTVTSGTNETLTHVPFSGSGRVAGSTSPTITNLTLNGAFVTPTVTLSSTNIDLSTGATFTKAISANTTFTFSNPTEGQSFTVVVTNSSTYTVTWPAVEWKGGSTPVQSSSQTDIYTFAYVNGKYLGAQIPGVSPGYEQEAYSAGTVYSLTATAALLDFGTTDPTITVGTAGDYMIYWGANVKYNGATFASNQSYTIKVRRTNNTAADVSNATITQTTRVITTVTDNAGLIGGKPVKYTAAAGDILQVWGALSATPSVGSVDVTDAWIVIVRIQ